jgi:hypothetical protein
MTSTPPATFRTLHGLLIWRPIFTDVTEGVVGAAFGVVETVHCIVLKEGSGGDASGTSYRSLAEVREDTSFVRALFVTRHKNFLGILKLSAAYPQ